VPAHLHARIERRLVVHNGGFHRLVGQRLRRATLVGLDDDPEHRDFAFLERTAEVFQRPTPGAAPILRLPLEPLSLLRDIPGFDRIGHHREDVSCCRNALESENLYRERGTDGLHRLSSLVVQGAYPAGELAADEVVAADQGAPLHQYGG
jgi:hypothetical protein